LEQLQTSCITRLEFLASSLYAIGEKEAAYQSYLKAIQSRPKAFYIQFESSTECAQLQERVPALSKSIQRLTRIGVLDLMKTATDCSLALSLAQHHFDTSVLGLILEEQVAALH